MTDSDGLRLSRNEWIVLLAIYCAKKNGDTLTNDMLVERTGLTLKEIESATGYLEHVAYIA